MVKGLHRLAEKDSMKYLILMFIALPAFALTKGDLKKIKAMQVEDDEEEEQVEVTPAPILCPNGKYISKGVCTLCPDGTYVANICRLMPDGKYIGD